jgi:CAAX prenyl protease-like protein
VIARIVPFAVFIAFVAAQPLLEDRFDARWLVAMRGVAVAALLAVFWRHYSELRERLSVPLREWALAVVLGVLVFLAWITFDSGWAAFGQRGTGFVPLARNGAIDPTLVLLRLFGLVLVVPIMEELFWRSFLMRWIDKRDFGALDPRRTSVLAFALSSALFALEHSLWFAGLLAGLAYAWIYRRTGNLRAPILSHAITNGTLGLWILATGSWHLW